ncbi:MAG: alpha/beta fold hydrolase [Anaerolineae bacterium]|nr:alpha/beta fold hydrolase [Anaerolineae bacterium]
MRVKNKFLFSLIALLLLVFTNGAVSAGAPLQAGSKVHPVILVHGLSASGEVWQTTPTIFDELRRDGYNMDFVKPFFYPSGSGGREDTHADINLIAAKLAQEVDALSQASVAAGGPAQVDIVAHSLGGVATRKYLASHLQDHNIGKFIDLGTPHQGSALLAAYNDLTTIPDMVEELAAWANPSPLDILEYVDFDLRSLVNDFVHAFYVANDFGFIDPTRIASQQLDPRSDFMTQLNRPGLSPQDVEYSLIFADINLRFRWDIFGIQVVSTEIVSLGDMVVSRDNASTIPHLGSRLGPNPAHYHTYPFEAPIVLQLSMGLLTPAVEFPDLAQRVQQAGNIWHSNLIHDPEITRLVLRILNDGSPPTAAAAPTTVSSTADTATVLVIDSSSSMQQFDPSGVSKMSAAKTAGRNILNIIAAENQAAQGAASAQAAIVNFNTFASVDASLSTDIPNALAALDAIYSEGGTGIAAALVAAGDLLKGDSSSAKRIIILLSDGVPNIGLDGESLTSDLAEAEVLNLASQAGQLGICIYTVGLGDPASGDFNESFLRQVASNSGCGSYFNAQNAFQLGSVFVSLRHQSAGGTILLEESGSIRLGEQIDLGSVQVSAADPVDFYYTLNWPGSRLDPVLIDPTGKAVDENYPGASISLADTVATMIITNPVSGNWQVAATGVDVPGASTFYNALLSSRPSAAPPPPPAVVAPPAVGTPVGVVLIVVALSGLLIYVMAQRRSPAAAAPYASIQIIAGQSAGGSYNIKRGQFVIGRSAACDFRIQDPQVSRQHAAIRFAQGAWFIQDQGTPGGTLLNRQPVAAGRIRSGDQVTIGSTTFIFHEHRTS